MKLLGLIGGMSWENSIEYYRVINELVKEKLGVWNSAELILYSVNFEEIFSLQKKNDWKQIRNKMIKICKKLELAGSSIIVISKYTFTPFYPINYLRISCRI